MQESSIRFINFIMTINRNRLLACVFLGIFVATGGAQEPVVEEKKAEEVPAYVIKFGNLPQEKREAYGGHKLKAEQFFRQKRTFESLDEIHQALLIFDEDPGMWNLMGSCHVEFRSFEKASEAFRRALALNEKNTGILFNLAEMDFVTKNWKGCIEKMATLNELFEENSDGELSDSVLQIHRLALFKRMLAHLKLGEEKKARQLAEDSWEDFDDTPFTYYSKAALSYFEGEEEEAVSWLRSAARVFGGLAVANWQDTLIEFGYVRSFYGGDEGGEIELSDE